MKKHYYTAFWLVLCLIVGLFRFVQVDSIPYQVTLVKEMGDEAVLKSVEFEGSVSNNQLMHYYNLNIKDGGQVTLEVPPIWNLSTDRHSNQTMQHFPIWNRPDIREASGVTLPDGREFWIREKYEYKEGFRYTIFLIDKQKRTYEQKELQFSERPTHTSSILQLVVNQNQVDILVSKEQGYKAEALEDTSEVSWYRIDVSHLTAKHIKDFVLPAINPRLFAALGFSNNPERRFVFITDKGNNEGVVKVIDPLTEEEQVLSLPIKLDEYGYVQAEMESDILYVTYIDNQNHTITLSYDETQHKFIKIADTPEESNIRNGYVYQTNMQDADAPRLEVIELATGKVVYRGTLVVEGPEGVEVVLYLQD